MEVGTAAITRGASFLCLLHISNQERLCAEVQEALDQDRIVASVAHNCRNIVRCDRLQLRQNRERISWRMLGVE
jgi:hypothetical protein